LTIARPGESILSFFGLGHHSSPQASASVCANPTTAQSFLSQSLALIKNLQANSSTNAILQLELPNFVAYLQNITNQVLLSNNCTIFITNLKGAKLADEVAEQKREHLAAHIEELFEQVGQNVTGSRQYHELDVGEQKKHRF
jgi:hypothetical protein